MATFYGTWFESTKFPTRIAKLQWYGADTKAKVAWMAQQFYSLSEVQKRYPSFPGVNKCICIAKQLVYKESSWEATKTNKYVRTEVTASISSSSDRITLSGHGLINGSEIQLSSLSGGTGLANSTGYYVRNATSSYFQVSSTPTGNIINVTTNGTCKLVYKVYGLWQVSNIHSQSMAQWPTKNGYNLSTLFNEEYNTRLAFTIMNSAVNAYENPWLDWSAYNGSAADSPVKVCL